MINRISICGWIEPIRATAGGSASHELYWLRTDPPPGHPACLFENHVPRVRLCLEERCARAARSADPLELVHVEGTLECDPTWDPIDPLGPIDVVATHFERLGAVDSLSQISRLPNAVTVSGRIVSPATRFPIECGFGRQICLANSHHGIDANAESYEVDSVFCLSGYGRHKKLVESLRIGEDVVVVGRLGSRFDPEYPSEYPWWDHEIMIRQLIRISGH